MVWKDEAGQKYPNGTLAARLNKATCGLLQDEIVNFAKDMVSAREAGKDLQS